MKDKPDTDRSTLLMEEAHQLMTEGQSREALRLALDALVHALNHLQHSLHSLQQGLGQIRAHSSRLSALQERLQPGPDGLPKKNPHVLH